MGIVQNVREIVQLVKETDNLELHRMILDLQAEAMELADLLRQKDERIEMLEGTLSTKEKMICKDSAYYLTDDDGIIVDGPFCTRCFDIDYVQCRLGRSTKRTRGKVLCLNCRTEIYAIRTFRYLLGNTQEFSEQPDE